MRTIKATPNYSKRTFTIRKYENGKCYAKFRTFKLSELEFTCMKYDTPSDWEYFLRSQEGAYYEVN